MPAYHQFVKVSENECWTSIIDSDTIQISIMRVLHFLIPVGYGDLTVFFVPDTIWVYIPCKNLHTCAKLS